MATYDYCYIIDGFQVEGDWPPEPEHGIRYQDLDGDFVPSEMFEADL